MSIASSPTTSVSIARAGLNPSSATATRRLIAAVVATACAAILGLSAWLTPSPTGIGTHEQLNLPKCGWIAMADMPCPTCGMTTAFAHAARGNLLASFQAQPMGCLLAIATAMTLLVSIYVIMTGSPLARVFLRLGSTYSGWALAIMVLAAWAYKIVSYKGWL